MKFFNRQAEIVLLQNICERAWKSAQMTVLVGRRRIGKTRLILESMAGNQPVLYFFIARKEERLLCQEFVEQIQRVLNIPVFGEINRFAELFGLLMNYARGARFTLIIDEFQEFTRLNPSVYSDMQREWDLHKDHAQINLILCGSVYSLMQRIFEDAKEPLFGRANERLYIKPFSTETLKEILAEYAPGYTPQDLLTFYMLTGGVPKYVELLVEKNKLSHEAMLEEVFHENSFFLEEGKNLLVEEFGKDYASYFSILALIASSKTSRSEIESVLQKDVGGYLSRLENEYRLIGRVQPIFSKPGSRNIKYYIADNLLSFWFRFVYKNASTIEIGNFAYLKSLVDRDFPAFSGPFLEKYFHEKLAASKTYSAIGRYWERDNRNEIDIVAINEAEKTALIGEVKLNKNQLSMGKLKAKALELSRSLGGYKVHFQGFSLEDM